MLGELPRSSIPHTGATSPNARWRVRSGRDAASLLAIAAAMPVLRRPQARHSFAVLERDPDAGEQVIGSLQVLESGLDPVVPTPLERSGRSDVTDVEPRLSGALHLIGDAPLGLAHVGAETRTCLVERLGFNAERRHPGLLPG